MLSQQTSQVPHENERFRRAMRNEGFDPDEAPFELKKNWQSFPVVKASVRAMKKAGYRPIFSP